MQNIIFLLVTIFYYQLLSYFVIRKWTANDLIALAVAPNLSLATFGMIVLVLGTFLQVPIIICWILNLLFWLWLNWKFGNANFDILKSGGKSWLYGVGVFLFFWICLLKPFVVTLPDHETFDFFSHWGYALKRLIVDGHVYTKATIFEYSTYDYPLIGSLWSYFATILTGNAFVMRFRTLELLATLGVLGVGLFNERNTRKWGFALVLFLTFFRIRYASGPFFEEGYTAMPDLTFGLFLMLCWLFYSIYLQTKARIYLLLTGLYSFLLTQIRYDGIPSLFIFLSMIFLILLYLFWKKDKIEWIDYLVFFSPAIVGAVFWIIYVKVGMGSPGSFNHLDYSLGFHFIPQMLIEMVKKVSWLSPVIVLIGTFLILAFKNNIPKIRLSQLLGVGLILGFLIFLAFFYGCVWQKVDYGPRMVGRVAPLAITLLFIQLLSQFGFLIQRPWSRFVASRYFRFALLIPIGLVFSESIYFRDLKAILNRNPNPIAQKLCVQAILKNGLNDKNAVFIWMDKEIAVNDYSELNFYYREAIYPSRVLFSDQSLSSEQVRELLRRNYSNLPAEDFKIYEVHIGEDVIESMENQKVIRCQ